MKYPLLPAWALCTLAGSLLAFSSAFAQSSASSGSSAVTAIRFCPRAACASRMVGGQFQGSNDDSAWTTLATIASIPVVNRWSAVTVANGAAFRYLRYLSPRSSYGNIAELEFDGPGGVKLNGVAFGSPGSFLKRGNDFTKVFDGSLTTFFDGPTPTGNFVGIDLGAPPVVTPPVLSPPVTTSPVAAPPAPAGLTAAAQFTTNCTVTDGMAMPHIVLSWNVAPGATYYTIYRNGAAVQVGVTPDTWTDMDLTSGQTYAYSVSATGVGGEGPQCAAISVKAPAPASGFLPSPPANVSVADIWQGATANTLSWQPVVGAVGYNVYVSDVQVASNLTGTTFTVQPTMLWNGNLFTVTSVDATGAESIPSAPAGFLNALDPANLPTTANWTPVVPNLLQAVSDWNQGGPRIVLKWHAAGNASTVFNVYRDGLKVASGLWRPYYLDSNLTSGASHTYTVTAVNTDWPATIEGTASVPLTVTALDSPPAALTGAVQITKVVANDDSAVVFFTPIPGATDYRISDVNTPGKYKYAGEITHQNTAYFTAARTPICIEWNGIDPAKGANLVVEAVDKWGPFQRMEGAAGAGVMNMNAALGVSLNGQGDPSNVPVVLAASAPVHITCAPTLLAGDQAFFDNFRTENPLVRQPIPAPVPDSPYYGQPTDYAVYTNDKWELRQYGADLTNSKLFFMDNHFMDTTFDGGGPGSPNGPHNNDASLVMIPKATADLTGGKVLHVTFEVDAHMDPRRWCSLMIGEPGDELVDPAKFDDFNVKPTLSGRLLRWQILPGGYGLQLFLGDGNMKGVDLMQVSTTDGGADAASVARTAFDYVSPLANGTRQDLDKRHRFDLYLSATHYRIMETTPDGMYSTVRDRDFPAGITLPFTKCQAYFIHQVYHTFNDRNELLSGYPADNSYESYWFNYRPFSDERHWDNCGFSVLDAFPQ